MGRSSRAIIVAAAAAALSASPAQAGAPAHETFKPDGLKVSFELPSGWRKDLVLAAGWDWQAVAPGSVAHLYVNGIPSKRGFSVLTRDYAAALKKPYNGNPHYAFASSPVRVAGLPALKITFRYRNVTMKEFPVEVATIYAFVHGGRFYVFDYVATPTRIATMRPVFERSIRSVRFLA